MIKFSPFDSFGVCYPISGSRRCRRRHGIGLCLVFRLLLALYFVGFVFVLILLTVVLGVFLVVNTIMIRRRGGVRRRQGGSDGGGDFIVKHRQELLVIESIKFIPVTGSRGRRGRCSSGSPAIFLEHWHFEECDGITNRPTVGSTSSRRKIEKFIDPRRIILSNRRRGGGRCKGFH